MALKSYANFEKKLTRGLIKDLRNLANFHQSTGKCQNWDFGPKQKRYDLKIYRGVMFHDNEE